MPIDPILGDLNGDQYRAVTFEQGPLLVLAGAGSGKTRVLTRRVAWLIRDRAVPPWRILAMTFTNKAANEMRGRVIQLLGREDAPTWMGTFHSVALRWLRRYGERVGLQRDFVVYDEDDQEALLKRVLRDMGLQGQKIGEYRGYIDHLKDCGFFEPPEDSEADEKAEVFRAYQRALAEANAVDFGDLLCLALKLLRENEDIREYFHAEYMHVLVDEFQDTNLAQYEILKALLGRHRNICVVGDDDQSIYSWRGARVENILGFRNDFPDAAVVTLRSNYRSMGKILRIATKVIEHNKRRHPKELFAARGEGGQVAVVRVMSEKEEALFVLREIKKLQAEGVPISRIAVLYRTHSQSRPFEEVFRAARVPYRITGGIKFFQRKEIKDVLAYLRVLVNPEDSVSLERILNVPPRGLGGATLSRAREEARTAGVSLLMGLARVADKSGPAMRERITNFLDLILSLAEAARNLDAAQVLEMTLERSGYMEYLRSDTSVQAQERLENVEELVLSVREFVSSSAQTDVGAYLDRVALLQPADEAVGEGVNLMTIHAAKGLEFECVFICGLEEGLLPHFNAFGDSKALEEERRLMYVAMTRARDHLYMTFASTRTRLGGIMSMQPSRFLADAVK